VHVALQEKLGVEELTDVQSQIDPLQDLESQLFKQEQKLRKLVADRYVRE
jgi:hypothetical protein